CARSTRMASMRCWQTFARAASTSDIPLMVTGATHARKDQIGIVGGDRPLLHNQQEQEADAGEDGNQEVRPRRPQTRHVQGNQAQVTRSVQEQDEKRRSDWRRMRHPRVSGDRVSLGGCRGSIKRHWIPAFAGMTTLVKSPPSSGGLFYRDG